MWRRSTSLYKHSVTKTTAGSPSATAASATTTSPNMIRPGAHPVAIEAGVTRSFPTNTRRNPDGTLPPVNGHRNMSTNSKDAKANNSMANGGKRRRGPQQAGMVNAGGAANVDINRPYTSARLNAVRNSSMNKRPPIPPQAPQDRGKLTVVLDVDETLIHSRLSSQQEAFRQAEERKDGANSCDEFTITLEDGETVRVNKRPGLDKFLQHMAENYETIAYTAGLEEYARPLLDWLDPNGVIFRHRLYRDSCLFMRGYYLKDMQKVNRPLGRICLVDNNAFCFLPQLSNGIPISSFYDDPNDTALSVLTTFLDRIKDEKDVRPFLRKSFNLETLLKDHREQIVG